MPSVKDVIAFLTSIGEKIDVRDRSPELLDWELTGVSSDIKAGSGDLSWISPRVKKEQPERLSSFKGTFLIAPISEFQPGGAFFIAPCRRPKLAFIRVVSHFFGKMTHNFLPGKDDEKISADAIIAEDAFIGAGVVIGQDVKVGRGCRIGPNTVISNASIGEQVTIGSNCSIGGPGFGYERDEDGRYWRFPHLGRVVIESNVDIGSNTCIDRGALDDTVIGSGVKIDNLVHVAHNVVIKRNSIIIANSMIGGSVTIGEKAWLAPSTSILNKTRIGDSALIGMGSVVVKDVEEGMTAIGVPARPIRKRKDDE